MLEKQLIELGLNKYEANAYLYILKHGISEAGSVYKNTTIPYGKIYDTLNSLVIKGLLEVQNKRPKKYMPKRPRTALNRFYAEKKKQMDADMEKTRKLITDIGEEIDNIEVKNPTEKSFWKTAMENEIPELIRSNFEEAENEVCVLLYPPKNAVSGSHYHSEELDDFEITQNEMLKAFERGVKLRILSSKELGMLHAQNNSEQEKNMQNDNIEIRFTDETFPAYFTIIDHDKVVFSIIDPIEQNNVIAMTKVWDQRLAAKLQEKFEKMWETAKILS